MHIHETAIGFEIETPEYLFFFGNKDSKLENLRKSYSQFDLARIRQVHGNVVVQTWKASAEPIIEADGHYTDANKTALIIATADCIPVLIASARTKTVMALHAGWRGVANRIVPTGLRMLLEDQSAEGVAVIIGPHIQQSSFEVGLDVKNQLLAAVSGNKIEIEELVVRNSSNPDKFLVDLNALVKMQIAEYGVQADHVFDLHLDTLTDTRFHSFRRDKEQSGRNLSFVVKK